jgi:hypothetical protein
MVLVVRLEKDEERISDRREQCSAGAFVKPGRDMVDMRHGQGNAFGS